MELFERWEEIVGARMAQKTKPLKLTPEGVLLISVADASWNHHLRFMEGQILQKIRNTLKREDVKALKFFVGRSSS